jgi:hypothetical protein
MLTVAAQALGLEVCLIRPWCCAQEYCISREDVDFVMSVTHFKSKGEWSEDPMKGVETKVKSAFTRTFNQTGGRARCNIAVDDFKRKGRKGAAAIPSDEVAYGESYIEVHWLSF